MEVQVVKCNDAYYATRRSKIRSGREEQSSRKYSTNEKADDQRVNKEIGILHTANRYGNTK